MKGIYLQMETLPKMLTVNDIQNHLGISRPNAYALVNLKDFPKIQIGRKFFIPEPDYLKWIEKYTKRKVNIDI